MLQICSSGKRVRSWQSWWRACRASLPWVTIETAYSPLSSPQLYATSSSVFPDCLWSTATPVYLHWSVCEGCEAVTLCPRIHLSIKGFVCRFGNWGGPLSQEETTALHCQRFPWTSCRKKMSSESSCTASTRSVHNHTHNPSNGLSLCLVFI